jgi:hypothetical protein
MHIVRWPGFAAPNENSYNAFFAAPGGAAAGASVLFFF